MTKPRLLGNFCPASVVSVLAIVLVAACSEDANELGGDTNLSMTKVGQVVRLSAPQIGGTAVNIQGTGTVTKNDNGIVTLRVKVDLSKEPSLAIFAGLLPDSARDEDGNIDTEFDLRITSEGMQDFFDEKPHTYVKYDASVGDKYALTTDDGLTITREVTARSNKDDFRYGMMLIKTLTVQQNSRIPGIEKINYRANHKFGIVWLELVTDEGSTASTYIMFPN